MSSPRRLRNLFHIPFMTLRSSASGALGLVLAIALALPSLAIADDPPFEVTSLTSRTTDVAEADYTAAGGHPFQFKNDYTLTTRANGLPVEEQKDASVTAPPGFLGNPVAFPRCPLGNIRVNGDGSDASDCPPGSQVGFVGLNGLGSYITLHPLYSVIPEHGYPAQFAFRHLTNTVSLYASLLPRTDSYRIAVGATNTPRGPDLAHFITVFYGAPFQHGSGTVEAPFLSNPLDCSQAGPSFDIALDSWTHAGTRLFNGLPDLSDPDWKTASAVAPAVTACDDPALTSQWHPALGVKPLQGGGPIQADQPAGLAVDLDFPQSNDPTDLNTTFDPLVPQAPEPKDIMVKLPAGLVVSPSSAGGLGACSDLASDPAGDQVHYDDTKPVRCPDASKIGSAVVTSPLLAIHDPITDAVIGADPVPGDVYLLKPRPGDLPIGGGGDGKFRLLIQLESARYGLNVKLSGIATADKQTGRLTAMFPDNPQLASKHFQVSLKAGPRAPLATPATCGNFVTNSDFVPWSTPGTPDASPSASFNVGSGPNGTGCVSTLQQRPFSPALNAGAESGKAGASTPFVMKLTRNDGEQEFSSLDLTTPPGLTAKLAGVPYCSEAAIAAVANRSGVAEQSNPSCPPASQIGTLTTASGPGSSPLHVSGKAYLAGPYKGAPLSFVFITPAVAGPFDLGNVPVRAAAYVNSETAQVTVKTDPIPQILDGVPLRIRSIAAHIDRTDFTRNPTSCAPMSVSATVAGASGASATPSDSFQVGDCEKLGFKPNLQFRLKGGTRRSDHPALKAVLTYPSGSYANIAKVSVNLPHSEFLAQDHIKTICTRVQFGAGAGNGAECPKGSIYGFATATTPLLDQPLSGPVFLRSSSHPLPDMVMALHGQIDVALAGRIDSKNGGIRASFDAIPDAPVSKFVLNMQGGKKGLLENSGNLCKSTSRVAVAFTGQNGKTANSSPVLSNGCKKKKAGKGGKGHGAANRNWPRTLPRK